VAEEGPVEISPTDPLGIVLILVGAFVAFRVARLLFKLVMVAVALLGLYLWLGVG
jgi:hypothetical protein